MVIKMEKTGEITVLRGRRELKKLERRCLEASVFLGFCMFALWIITSL
jgi:hypothetical protein